MKKNSKTVSIVALVLGLFASNVTAGVLDLFGDFGFELGAPTEIHGEAGFVKDRIDQGLFSQTDAVYASAGATLGTFNGGDVVGNLLFVGDDSYLAGGVKIVQDNKSVGLALSDSAADGVSGDTDLEITFGYVQGEYAGILVSGSAALAVDGGLQVALNADRDLITIMGVNVSAHAEVGKTWGYATNYDYVLGAVRGSYAAFGGGVYAEVAALDNGIQTDGFDGTFKLGYTKSF
jgi:hypothetical protein